MYLYHRHFEVVNIKPVNPTKCVGGEAVHRLQAIDKLLFAGALEAKSGGDGQCAQNR